MSVQRAGLKWISNLKQIVADRRYCMYELLLQIKLSFVEIIFTHQGVAEASVLSDHMRMSCQKKTKNMRMRIRQNGSILIPIQGWFYDTCKTELLPVFQNSNMCTNSKNVGTVFIKTASIASCLKVQCEELWCDLCVRQCCTLTYIKCIWFTKDLRLIVPHKWSNTFQWRKDEFSFSFSK